MSRRTPLAGLGLLVAIMASPITATANDNALDHIIKTGIVRVAVPENFRSSAILARMGSSRATISTRRRSLPPRSASSSSWFRYRAPTASPI
jgi:hypothetical protein